MTVPQLLNTAFVGLVVLTVVLGALTVAGRAARRARARRHTRRALMQLFHDRGVVSRTRT